MKTPVLLLTGTIVLFPVVASAQAGSTGPSDTPPNDRSATTDLSSEEARRLFEAGVAALQDERYADALSLFEQSYRIRRSASALLNMGLSLRALGRFVEARQRFQQFRELASPSLRERYDSDVTGYLADIDRRIGHLRITRLEPPDAIVTIDGRQVRWGPGRETLIDPGEHRIEADAPGYTYFRQSIRVDNGGQVELPIVLQPLPRTDNSVTSQWWFWTVLGLGTAAAVVVPLLVATTVEGPLQTTNEIVVFAIQRSP